MYKQIRLTESDFHNLIVESLLRVINNNILIEGISDVTYHYCSLGSIYNILKDGKIKLTMSSNHADAYHKTNLFYLSTQRSKSNQIGYARNHRATCRIELDGYLLKTDGYQGKPIDYWGTTMGKQSDIGPKASRLFGRMPITTQDKKELLHSQGMSSNFEFEDRIFSNKPYLPLKYVKRIDCISDNKFLPIEKSILLLAKQNNINVSFYDSQKDFIFQTDNDINKQILSTKEEYEEKEPLRDDEYMVNRNSEIITNLASMLFYYKYYNTLNGNKDELYNELYDVLNKFNLTQFYDYVKENMPKTVMFIEDKLSPTMNNVRRLNTDEFAKSSISDNVMLFAQYVLNHYKSKSFSELAYYFKKHPWKKEKPSNTKIQEYVECVKLHYNGDTSYTILKADDVSFWNYIQKDYFYNELSRQVYNDEWNKQYGEDNVITHKSKDNESFKKYLQHLMYNDNLSLYKGAMILNKLFNWNEQEIDRMFGIMLEPIKLNKDEFIREENKVTFSDRERIVNVLFGNSEGYYRYRFRRIKHSQK